MPPLPRAILFDFDGTLVDSYEAIAASLNHVRAHHGLSPLPIAEVRRHVGHGVEYLMSHTVDKGRMEENVRLYRRHHPSVLREKTFLLPHAHEALAALSARGVALGICSNKPVDFTRQLLDHLGVASLFRVVLGPEDVARPKPAPDMLLEGLQRLQVAAQDALYVGDMTVDISTARQAGVPVWVVPTGSEERPILEAAGPDRLLGDLGEMLEALPGGK